MPARKGAPSRKTPKPEAPSRLTVNAETIKTIGKFGQIQASLFDIGAYFGAPEDEVKAFFDANPAIAETYAREKDKGRILLYAARYKAALKGNTKALAGLLDTGSPTAAPAPTPAALPPLPELPKLRKQQQDFVDVYLETGNGCEAYRRAYPRSTKWKPEAVRSAASALLATHNVSITVKAMQDRARRIALDRFDVSKERIIGELARCSFYRADDFFSWGPHGVQIKDSATLEPGELTAVTGVSMSMNTGEIKIRLADKLSALEKLAKIAGHVVEKHEVELKGGGISSLLAQARAQRVQGNGINGSGLSNGSAAGGGGAQLGPH